jgi:hypothetical protein
MLPKTVSVVTAFTSGHLESQQLISRVYGPRGEESGGVRKTPRFRSEIQYLGNPTDYTDGCRQKL